MNNENNTTSAPFNAGLAYAEYKQRRFFYILAACVAFLMSSYFVVGYLAGHLRIMEWDGSQWLNGLVAIGITGTMTGYQFILYGSGNVIAGKKATIVAEGVAVAFSLLSEVGQGMERDNIRMETKSQNSPTYKAIVGSLSGASSAAYNPYSADLQSAEMKLAQCQERLARGKEKHCQGSAARVDAVNKMIANSNQASNDRALALANTAKTLERDEANYQPLVNVIREFFGLSGVIGSFMLSLTLISFFEYAFHYLGGKYAEAREYLMKHGYDVTRRLRQPPRQFDGSVKTYASDNQDVPVSAPLAALADRAKMTVGDYANKVESGLKASPEIIATELARANYAHNQMVQDAGEIAGKVGNKLDGLNKTYRQELNNGESVYSDTPLDKPRPGIPKMSVEETVKQIQASVKASGANSPQAIQAAVFDAFAAIPNPAPLNDTILERIADKLTTTSAPVAALVPFGQKAGLTGIHSPVLGTEEEHYELSLSPVVTPSPRCLNSVVDNEKLTTENALKKVADLEQELANQKAEMEAQRLEADNARQRAKASAQAKLEADREERNRAEAARELEVRQRAALEADNARQRAEEAAATAARELAAAEALATEKAERGALTDEQIELATAVIRTAITEGHIQKVGTPQVSPILKAAGLPTGAPIQRVLHKLACKQLETEGLVVLNPNKANGQPLYLIA